MKTIRMTQERWWHGNGDDIQLPTDRSHTPLATRRFGAPSEGGADAVVGRDIRFPLIRQSGCVFIVILSTSLSPNSISSFRRGCGYLAHVAADNSAGNLKVLHTWLCAVLYEDAMKSQHGKKYNKIRSSPWRFCLFLRCRCLCNPWMHCDKRHDKCGHMHGFRGFRKYKVILVIRRGTKKIYSLLSQAR